MVGTMSCSMLLDHEGRERPGVRLVHKMGRSPIRQSLGSHGKELGLHPEVQWF